MMNGKITLFSLCTLIGAGVSAQSADTMKAALKEVVITSTKIEHTKKEEGRTVTVITGEDLEKLQGKSLAEMITELSGVYIDGSYSSHGNNLGYYLRGGRNGQILVLIDGIPVNDPSDITSSFDFRHLSADQIDQIEIVKGGLSTLYGTDAVAGVINIKTKDAGKKKAQGFVDANYGSYNTINASANINGRIGKFFYLAGADFLDSDGFSAALDTFTTPLIDSSYKNPQRTPFDNDAFSRQNYILKAGYDLGQLRLQIFGNLNNYKSDIDNGSFLDDENRTFESRQYLVAFVPSYFYKKGKLSLKLSYQSVDRTDFNDSTEFVAGVPLFSYLNGYTTSNFIGNNLQLDIHNEYQVNEYVKALAGMGYQQLSYESDLTAYGDFMGPNPGQPVGNEVVDADTTNFSQVDPYLMLMLKYKGFNLHGGVRANYHSQYGDFFAWSVNPFYLWKLSDKMQLKPYASLSTAFKSPTLFQLYSAFGNENLNPERSTSYEAGLSAYVLNKIELNGVWFSRDEDSTIIFGLNGYENGGMRNVSGMEFSAKYSLNKKASIRGYYSYVISDDTTSLYRIPKDQFGAIVSVSPVKNGIISVNYLWVGERTILDYDMNFMPIEVDLASYSMLNLHGSYSWKRLTGYAGINNILGSDFVSISGFATKGRNYVVGVKFKY